MTYPFFSKYQQFGNDFIIFDDRNKSFPEDNSLIKNICDRRQGIGADGIILLQVSSNCDYFMRIFNSNGVEAESCGNGICCLAQFIKDQKFLNSNEITIELIDSSVSVNYVEEKIVVKMKNPTHFEYDKVISLERGSVKYHFVNTGVPHFVTFVDDLKKIDVQKDGLFIRNHSNFMPSGTNVNFATIVNNSEIYVRTYERGVEEETLACGTGACAVALIASYVYNLSSPLKICHPGGIIAVNFKKERNNFQSVSIVGAPKKVYNGWLSMKYKNGDAIC